MRATYKVIDFDRIIPKPVHTETVHKHGKIEDTVKKMQDLSVKYITAMTLLARHLQASSDIQTFFNLFHFVKTYIRYEYDTFGKEVLRSPLRTWHDKKGDCDCMSIFMASVLLALGYEPYFVLVKTFGGKNFSHVYIEVQGVSLDPVIDQNNALPFEHTFNQKPPNVTESKKIKVMDIVTLEGIDCIHGLEATVPPDNTTLYLMQVQSELIESNANPKELRKIRYLIMLNGSDARDIVLKLMPYIDDVINGELIFKPNTDMNQIADLIEQLEQHERNPLWKNYDEYQSTSYGLFQTLGIAMQGYGFTPSDKEDVFASYTIEAQFDLFDKIMQDKMSYVKKLFPDASQDELIWHTIAHYGLPALYSSKNIEDTRKNYKKFRNGEKPVPKTIWDAIEQNFNTYKQLQNLNESYIKIWFRNESGAVIDALKKK